MSNSDGFLYHPINGTSMSAQYKKKQMWQQSWYMGHLRLIYSFEAEIKKSSLFYMDLICSWLTTYCHIIKAKHMCTFAQTVGIAVVKSYNQI